MTLKTNLDIVTSNNSNNHLENHFQSQNSQSDQLTHHDLFKLKKSYYKRKKPLIKKSRSKKSNKNPFNHSLWSIKENMLYRLFLLEKGHLFNSNNIQKKEMKINVQMFQHIKVRSADQCRSHHQKMIKHFGSVHGIVEHIQKLMEQKGQQIDRNIVVPDGKNEQFHSPLKDLTELQKNDKMQESLWEKLMKETHTFHLQKLFLTPEVHL